MSERPWSKESQGDLTFGDKGPETRTINGEEYGPGITGRVLKGLEGRLRPRRKIEVSWTLSTTDQRGGGQDF